MGIPIVYLLIALLAAAGAAVWAAVVASHRREAERALERLAARRWSDSEIERLLADQARIAELGVFAEGGERDAGPILNPMIGVDKKGFPADAPAWWSAWEVVQAMGRSWIEHGLPDEPGDLSFLAALLDRDHWDTTGSGAYGRYLAEGRPVFAPGSALTLYLGELFTGAKKDFRVPLYEGPGQVELHTLAKLRLLQGLEEPDFTAALREVRHLAALIYTEGSMFGVMVAAAILAIERRGYEVAVERGLLEAGVWTPVSAEDVAAIRRGTLSLVEIAAGLAGPEALERLLAAPGPICGLRAALHEAAWLELAWRGFTGPRWPLETPHPALEMGPEALWERIERDPPTARAAREGTSRAQIRAALLGLERRRDRWAARLGLLPYLRREMGVGFLLHLTAQWNWYRREGGRSGDG